MLELRELKGADREQLLRFRVSPDQEAFVEPMVEVLATTALSRENFVMSDAGDIVGFFQVDSSSGEQAVADSLSLHEVQIDVSHQGRGYGKQFILQLRDFLAPQYPDWTSVCLTVNCRNTVAHRLYKMGGFVDTGDLYHEGRSGPQHIMVMALGGA